MPKRKTSKNRKFRPQECTNQMNFQECELAILRHVVDENEKIAGEKLASGEEIKKMIQIVEDFLVKKKLICYGGTAINNILPKHAQFYDKNYQIPDYDFFSHNAMEDAKELADIFFKYGEVRLSRRIARRIVEKRPFETTTELAEAIAYSVPRQYRYGRIHPATRVFQALRIVVNDELKALETFLDQAPNALVPGGRIAIISFHSLEDRPVKHGLRNSSLLKVLTKKPITAREEELANNPRSRSAKLRIAQRVDSEGEARH